MLNPLDSVILHKADDPMAVEGEPPASFLGSFIIKLRAVCAAPDYTVAKRRDVGSFFEQKSIETMVLDIIYDSMKRVRAAVRMSDLQSRQISLFLKLNAGTYSVHSVYSVYSVYTVYSAYSVDLLLSYPSPNTYILTIFPIFLLSPNHPLFPVSNHVFVSNPSTVCA